MGLDMYMVKAKRFGNVTVNEVLNIGSYLDWCCRPAEYKSSTMDSWNSTDEDVIDHIDRNALYFYMGEMKMNYPYWDTEKGYGYYSILTDVGYWRKSNAIHHWFVENVQKGNDDCGSYEVSKEQLEKLLAVCLAVKDCFNSKGDLIRDRDFVENSLPTTDGFFFGDTDYNEWYLADVKTTIKIIKNILKHTDFDKEMIIYSSSW